MNGYLLRAGIAVAILFAGVSVAAADSAPANNCTFPGSNPDDNGGCLVTGAFTVPFKFELTHQKDVFGSASLNGFLGYNSGQKLFPGYLKFLGYTTYIGFVGYSANLNSTSNSATQTSTSASTGAISYGLGFAFPIGGTIQTTDTSKNGGKISVSQVHVGAVLGFDHTSSSLKYLYNDKPWISLFIGTSF